MQYLYSTDMKQPAAQPAAAPDRTGEAGPLLFALMHAAQHLEDRLESGLASAGLSLAKYGVLAELVKAGEPLSLSELATRLSCVRSNMTQLIDRLEGDGLVRRVDDPQDRRTVRAALTPQGRTQAQAGSAAMLAIQTQFEAALPERDRAMLERVLHSLS
jgi:DNA-binding MarR family transcriptional regulator